MVDLSFCTRCDRSSEWGDPKNVFCKKCTRERKEELDRANSRRKLLTMQVRMGMDRETGLESRYCTNCFENEGEVEFDSLYALVCMKCRNPKTRPLPDILPKETGKTIYFIATESRKFVKIGIADDKHSRLKNLQVGNPEELILLGSLWEGSASHNHERHLHNMFTEYRVRGEWFLLNDEILKYIENNS